MLLGACTSTRAPVAAQLEFDPQQGEWVEIPPPQPGTPDGDLRGVRADLADGHLGPARRGIGTWLKIHGTGHALSREARLTQAEIEYSDADFYKSYTLLKDLTADSGTDDITEKARELQFNIAEIFLSGRKRKFIGIRMLPSRDLGIKILDELSSGMEPTTLVEDALLTKADYYFGRGEFALAEDEYGRLIDGFPQSRRAPVVHLRRAQAALGRFPGIHFDDGALVEAEERFLRYRDQFPRAAERHNVDLILEDIRNRRAQKDYSIGEYYGTVGQTQAAVFYYRSVVQHWEGTRAAAQAATALSALGQEVPQTGP